MVKRACALVLLTLLAASARAQVYTPAESGGAPPMTTVPYAGGNFTGSASMTWTVEAGDIGYFAYSQTGNIMFVVWKLDNTVVGGSISNVLQIKIPNNKTAVKSVYGSCWLQNPTTWTLSMCLVPAGGTNIQLYGATPGAAHNAGALNAYGSLWFEVQ